MRQPPTKVIILCCERLLELRTIQYRRPAYVVCPHCKREFTTRATARDLTLIDED